MQMILFKMASAFMNMHRVIGEGSGGVFEGDSYDYKEQSWYKDIITPIVEVLNMILAPILILLGSAGAIYAIVLGVNLSRAESADKREEAKKRLINFVIGIVAAIVLLALLQLLVLHVDDVIEWFAPKPKKP